MKTLQNCHTKIQTTTTATRACYRHWFARENRPLLRALAVLSAAFSGFPAQGAGPSLELFQGFVNGRVPVKEAVVTRQILQADGTVQNQESWRFGCQDGTWYVQRLLPDAKSPLQLAPRPNTPIVGASFTDIWAVTDRDLHLADRNDELGSGPSRMSSFSRGLMLEALSLGLPRRPGIRSLTDSEIEWAGSRFTTLVVSKRGTTNALPATGRLTGELRLGLNGLPTSAAAPVLGEFPGCSVTYQYADTNAPIPSVFVVKYPDRAYRYEFRSLKSGTNDLTPTGGYVPSLFADLALKRNVTLWTNHLAYSLINGKLIPAFRPPRPKPGDPPPPLQGTVWFNTTQPLALEELRGKVVLLDFWGMWCPPCVKALPHLQAQYARFQDEGLIVIGIHTAWGTDKGLASFLREHGITFPVVVDTEVARADLHAGSTAEAYVGDELPHYALVDRNGKLAWQSSGGTPPTEAQIKELLERAPPK